MLMLSRKLGESIVIDGRIHVTVQRIGRCCVRLSVEAPPHVPVDRQEVLLRKLEEQVEGTSHSTS